MKLKATASFSGIRGNRAYNEVFEIPDDEGQALIEENYPVEVVDGPAQTGRSKVNGRDGGAEGKKGSGGKPATRGRRSSASKA